MPFIHRYICANPVECPNADKKMRKFWFKKDRNYEAKYLFASVLKCHYNSDNKEWWW